MLRFSTRTELRWLLIVMLSVLVRPSWAVDAVRPFDVRTVLDESSPIEEFSFLYPLGDTGERVHGRIPAYVLGGDEGVAIFDADFRPLIELPITGEPLVVGDGRILVEDGVDDAGRLGVRAFSYAGRPLFAFPFRGAPADEAGLLPMAGRTYHVDPSHDGIVSVYNDDGERIGRIGLPLVDLGLEILCPAATPMRSLARLAGSSDGSLFVGFEHAPLLRKYDPSGALLFEVDLTVVPEVRSWAEGEVREPCVLNRGRRWFRSLLHTRSLTADADGGVWLYHGSALLVHVGSDGQILDRVLLLDPLGGVLPQGSSSFNFLVRGDEVAVPVDASVLLRYSLSRGREAFEPSTYADGIDEGCNCSVTCADGSSCQCGDGGDAPLDLKAEICSCKCSKRGTAKCICGGVGSRVAPTL